MALIDINPALRAFLLADDAISSAVGAARIYPVKLPQGETRTSVVVAEISNAGDHHMQGASGLTRPRIQFDVYAQSIDAARSLARLIKEYIDGYSGAMGSVQVQGCFFDNQREGWENESTFYRVSGDFLIWYGER